MQFLYKPDGKNEMRYHDGTKNIRLNHPDQMSAIIDNFKRATGRDIAIFELGTPQAPWAARFEQCFPLVDASTEWGR